MSRGAHIRTCTHGVTGRKSSYTYDSQERPSYTLEADEAGARTASWLYCWDKLGNLTFQDSSASTCPAGAVPPATFPRGGRLVP